MLYRFKFCSTRKHCKAYTAEDNGTNVTTYDSSVHAHSSFKCTHTPSSPVTSALWLISVFRAAGTNGACVSAAFVSITSEYACRSEKHASFTHLHIDINFDCIISLSCKIIGVVINLLFFFKSNVEVSLMCRIIFRD